jgi:ribosomal protein S18 acetylase RimI-like enzyme
MSQPDAVSEQYFSDGSGERLGAFGRDGRLVASAVAHSAHHDRDVAIIVVHVHPDMAGCGIDTFLMQWSQAKANTILAADTLGRTTIEVHSESLTDNADDLYRSYGFDPVDASLVMQRDLQEPLPALLVRAGQETVMWLPELASEFARAYGPAFSDRPGFPGWSAAEWVEGVRANDLVPNWSLLARIGDKPVGYVIGCADLSAQPPGGYIWQVGVVASQRRKGIGSALMVESMRRMQADAVPWVELTVHVDNPAAIQAYEQLGFRTVGRRAKYRRVASAGRT